ILFITYGISIGSITNEWKNDTVGWWLTLPFPRIKLIVSKSCAAYLKGILFQLIIFLALALLALYTMILSDHFEISQYLSFLHSGINWFILIICINPFMAMMGVFYGVTKMTHHRYILPLFWGFWFVLWWVIVLISGSEFGEF